MARLSEEDRANLVAYLDGELDAAATQELEAKLNVDPEMRGEADSLKRTWELLDYLPKPEPSASFAHRTLERLAINENLSRTQPLIRKARWPWAVAWAAAVLIAVGVGRMGASWLFPPPQPRDVADIENQMAQHLRLLENKYLYDAIEDLDFLLALDHPELFGDDSES